MSDAQLKKKRSGTNWAKLQNTPQRICISLNNNDLYCNLTPSSKMQRRGNSGGQILTGILQLLHKLCSFVGWEKLIISVFFMKDLRRDRRLCFLIQYVANCNGKWTFLNTTPWVHKSYPHPISLTLTHSYTLFKLQ